MRNIYIFIVVPDSSYSIPFMYYHPGFINDIPSQAIDTNPIPIR